MNSHSHPPVILTRDVIVQATRYNYSSQEQFALIEVIGMVKSVQSQLIRLDASYSEGVRNAIYTDLQTFVQCTLNEPYRKAQKNKKTIIAWLIDSIRAACQDKVVVPLRVPHCS